MKYEDIKKITESCHLNFLIGSGASRPFLDTLSDIETALENFYKRVGLRSNQKDRKVLKLIEVSIKHYYFNRCIKRNIELLSTKDDSNKTLNTYKNLLNSLQTILLKRYTNIISKQVNLFTTNMDIFLDLALDQLGYAVNDGFSGRMKPKFGTENFHNIINKISSHYEYQSTVPLFNLFKLHGSLNWEFNKDDDTIYYDGNLKFTKEVSEINFSQNELIECFEKDGTIIKSQFDDLDVDWDVIVEDFLEKNIVTKIDDSKILLNPVFDINDEQSKILLGDDFEKKRSILKKTVSGKSIPLNDLYEIGTTKEIDQKFESKLDKFLDFYDKLVMVNPNKDKFEETTLKYSYYELLRMYSNNLERENSILFVSGFSFADEHICKITTRVAKANPTLLILVFAFDKQAEEDIKKNLGVAENIVYLSNKEENMYFSTVIEKYIGKLANELKSASNAKVIEKPEINTENGQ